MGEVKDKPKPCPNSNTPSVATRPGVDSIGFGPCRKSVVVSMAFWDPPWGSKGSKSRSDHSSVGGFWGLVALGRPRARYQGLKETRKQGTKDLTSHGPKARQIFVLYMIYVYVYMGYQIIAYYIKYEDPEAHLEDYPP